MTREAAGIGWSTVDGSGPPAAMDAWAAGVLAGAAWFPGAPLDAAGARVVDRLAVPGGAELLWVRVPGRSGAAGLVLLAAGAAAEHTAAAVAALGAEPGRTWPTAAGGAVHWRGLRVQPAAAAPVATTASNDLRRVSAGGRPALLKAYRLLGSDRGEHAALAALAGTGLVPELLAEARYRPAGGADLVLAVLTADLAGTTLDVPLRRSLHEAWRAGRFQPAQIDHARLPAVRSALDRLHACLAAAVPAGAAPGAAGADGSGPVGRADTAAVPGRGDAGPGPDGAAPLAVRTARLRQDAAAVLAATPAARLDGARRLLSAALATAGPGWYRPAPAHGDLHLSHVLVDERRVAFVDLGAPTADGCPDDDRVALRRAVECFGLDELVDRVARRQGRDQAVVAADLTDAALDPAVPAVPPGLPPESAREAAVLAGWTAWVCATLDPPPPTEAAAAARRVLYLARLLHDLRHHLERGDQYYAGLAWWHLARYCAPEPLAAPPPAATLDRPGGQP